MSNHGPLPNGVHYCPTDALYQVWIDGSVVAASISQSLANDIYVAQRRRERLKDFPAADQWMVATYGD
jgi:hypothetical protein